MRPSLGRALERLQHYVQDSAELYAVFVMQRVAEDLGVATDSRAERLRDDFVRYLEGVGVSLQEFSEGKYRRYRENADAQVPGFVQRIANHLQQPFGFRADEANQRNLAKKADFFIDLHDGQSIPVSLKNYIGSGGISRPQVASGTFLSFANSFVFEAVGVGKYRDSRSADASFQGSSRDDREAVLRYEGRPLLIEPLRELEDLNAQMREVLLGPDLEMYDDAVFKRVVADVVPKAHVAMRRVFELVGLAVVRATILSRAGMDGAEEAFFFDSQRSVDSLTNSRYRQLRLSLQDSRTDFRITGRGQSLFFEFVRADEIALSINVPFTINKNGAWVLSGEPYEGTRPFVDKNHVYQLRYGQRRPRKSREIATSINTYLSLSDAGVF